MNVEIGTEAAQLIFWEYINSNFFSVYNDALGIKEVAAGFYKTGILLCRHKKGNVPYAV
jgi:hypothetical protein